MNKEKVYETNPSLIHTNNEHGIYLGDKEGVELCEFAVKNDEG